MANRPSNTYVSQVFNFGVDKNIPLGFVNVVFNKDGSMAGFISDGKFYEPGEKLPESKSKDAEKKRYSGSIAERVAEAEKELEKSQKAAEFFAKKNRNQMDQKEATARGDIYDNYANSLKPQIDEYEFKLDFYARKIALGDKLSGIEENEIKDISKKYASIKKAYNEARFDAIDMYYGKKDTAETPTGKKIAQGKIRTPETVVTKPETKAVTPEVPVSGTKPDVVKKPEVTGDTEKSKGNVVEAAQLPNPPKGTSTTPAPLDTTIFEPTFTTGGVPAGYIPESEVATNKAGSVSDIAEKYGLSEALFKNIPSLKLIFEDYVNPKKKMTDDEFVRRIRNDVWYKKNSAGIKERFVQYYNYRDLQESGQAQGTTQYEQDIEGIVRNLERRAVEIGSAAASDPTALRNAAENIYLTNKEKDTTFIDDFLASSIRSVAGTIGGKTTQGYSGAALQNYNALVSAARNNGFQVADIIPGGANVDQVLQGIASGKIDVNRVVADARKLASQGQPQYVRDLLAQGYNLDQVFKPYRTAMANVLEIGDPDQIDLNDPLLRSAITDKGDMNLYDFKKALRQDSRWQYTEQAKKDVSTAALGVLRDFGFQG
jgi:hypothetical protein